MGLLAAALAGDDPVIFLEPKVLYRAGREEVPTSYYTIPIGRARIVREGTDVTVVTYGGMVPVVVKAAEQAGESVEIIDLRTLFPWDRQTVLASVEKTGRLVVVQEPQGSLRAPIVRVTGFDTPWPQFAIERHALITPARVLAGIKKVMEG
jgi:pyruvate dehydrogenase E1 component beta subunit